jgi:hypothetical protein
MDGCSSGGGTGSTWVTGARVSSSPIIITTASFSLTTSVIGSGGVSSFAGGGGFSSGVSVRIVGASAYPFASM